MFIVYVIIFFFFFKQKTAYEMRISDWSSDVCSSDLFEKTVHLGLNFLLAELGEEALAERFGQRLGQVRRNGNRLGNARSSVSIKVHKAIRDGDRKSVV